MIMLEKEDNPFLYNTLWGVRQSQNERPGIVVLQMIFTKYVM